MKQWKITTGDYCSEVVHEQDMTALEATVLAFKKKAPREVGVLTECTLVDETVFYVKTTIALEQAGYKVDETGK